MVLEMGESSCSPNKTRTFTKGKFWKRNELQPILIPKGVAMLVSKIPLLYYEHKNKLANNPEPWGTIKHLGQIY